MMFDFINYNKINSPGQQILPVKKEKNHRSLIIDHAIM